MTLTAAYRNDGYPVLIGDILLSSKDGSVSPATPTGVSIDPNVMLIDGLKPLRYSQKIAILSDNVAVIFSGDVGKAKSNIIKLRDLIRSSSFAYAIREWGKQLSSADLEMSTIIVSAIVDGLSYIIPFGKNWHEGTDKSGQAYIATGSGSDWLTRFSSTSNASHAVKGEFHAAELMCMNAIATGGQALIDEYLFGVRKEAFGGGWQAAWFNGEKFVFIEDILYVLWFCWHDSNGRPISMHPFTKMVRANYSGSSLYFDQWVFDQPILKRERRRHSCTTHAKIISTKVDPCLTDGLPTVDRRARIQTTERVFHYIVRIHGGIIIDRSLWSSAGDPKLSPVKFEQDGSTVKIQIQNNFYEKLMNIPLRWNWREGGKKVLT